MAKRNIEERFIVAAPIEEYTALGWFLKRLFGWPWSLRLRAAWIRGGVSPGQAERGTFSSNPAGCPLWSGGD